MICQPSLIYENIVNNILFDKITLMLTEKISPSVPAIYCMVKIIAHPDYKAPYVEHDVKFYSTVHEMENAKKDLIKQVTDYLQECEYCLQYLTYDTEKYYSDSYMDMQPYDISISKITVNTDGSIHKKIIFEIDDIQCPCKKCMSYIDEDNSDEDNSDEDNSDEDNNDEDNSDDNKNRCII